ncbi:phage tail tube protein [Actinokineospora globicatena]|uniref:Phage tail tube protein n=1 Tax=Actinokineospora globicatena TaxID=103729 RepID=A0A9W6QLE6_9PSEU|nr:hypothetical protein [Actinokineospora globicatena]GLW91770.1 hypothetical protein Aglo03_25860 [Actinokineospora globicatena]
MALKKRLSRKWSLWVDTGPDGTPNFVRLNGLSNLKLTIDGTEVDVTDFDSDGFEDSLTTMRKWSLAAAGFDGYTGADNAPTDDPAQAFLKTKGLLGGPDAYVSLKFYRADTLKGFTGRAVANWTGAGGEVKGVEPFECNFSGSGALTAYTHTP